MKKHKRRKSSSRNLRETHLFIVEGETEKKYLNNLLGGRRNRTLSVRVGKYPQPEKLVSQAIREQYAIGNNTKIWIICDADVNKINKTRERAEKKGIFLVITSPCLEYWFLLHFIYTTKFRSRECQPVIEELKRYVENYKKGLFDTRWGLLEKRKRACKNAKKLRKEATFEDCPYTNMDLLIDEMRADT